MPGFTLPRPLLLATLPVALVLSLSGCGGESDSSNATKFAVSAGDDSCEVATTDLAAGDTTFEITNDGSKVTEVYVYAKSGGEFTDVVSEVEDIGPGTSRDLDVDLSAGTYEVACKPGQQDDGIRTKITVTDGGKA